MLEADPITKLNSKNKEETRVQSLFTRWLKCSSSWAVVLSFFLTCRIYHYLTSCLCTPSLSKHLQSWRYCKLNNHSGRGSWHHWASGSKNRDSRTRAESSPMTKIQTTPLHFLSADLTKESGRGRMRAGGKEGGGLRTPTSTSSHDNPHQCHKCSLHSSKQQTNNMWQHLLGECMLLDTKSRPPFLSRLGGDRKWRDLEYWQPAGWLAG